MAEQAIQKQQKRQHPAAVASQWLNKRSDNLAKWCTSSMDPATLIRVGARLVQKEVKFQDPKTWDSLYLALITAGQLGLEPDGPRGEAYLIPYWDKNAKCELVQLMPGYRGIMRLVCNSPDVKTIRSQVVHEGDEFAANFMDPDDPGTNYHNVKIGTDRGPAVAVYSRVTYADGSHDIEIANWSEVEKARTSASGRSPAWEKWPEQMARKFIIKRHANQLPLDGVARQAIGIDNISSDTAAADAKAIIEVDSDNVIDAEIVGDEDKGSLAGKLASKSRARKSAAKKASPKPAPPPQVDDSAGDDFNQCGLCGEPTDGDVCNDCIAANDAAE